MNIRQLQRRKVQILKWDERFYRIGEEYFPRVTTILEAMPKEALLYYFGDLGTDKALELSEKAKKRGTHIHHAARRLVNGKEVNLEREFPEPDDKKMLLGLQNWFNDLKPKTVATEQTVYSLKHRTAGTLDWAGVITKENAIVDFKTSKALYDENPVQVAVYFRMVEETTNFKPKRAFILRLAPKTKKGYEFVDVADYIKAETKKRFGIGDKYDDVINFYFGIFLAAKKIWEYQNRDALDPIKPEEFPKRLRFFEGKATKTKRGGDK